MDAKKLDDLIDQLKRLKTAQRDSERACDACRERQPRVGVRGGKATTLQAKWVRAAEDRDRQLSRAADMAADVFGFQRDDVLE